MKLTKRKSFSFYRSYYDVFNELPKDDKLEFIEALLDKQFLDIDPKNLSGMVKFAYISQMDSIEKQVKGYQDKTKQILNPSKGVVSDPRQGVELPPKEQEKEKEKEKEKYILYSESVFLENWKSCRQHFLKKPTNIPKLTFQEKNAFQEVVKDYSKEDINNAMKTLFSQERVPVEGMWLRPKHFLEHFETYFSGNGETKIYSSKK